MSRYVRLRDAIDYCKEHRVDLGQFSRPEDIICQCCTCTSIKSWVYMHAGHFISRGMGGSSGVYFHEFNVNLQCRQCNNYGAGMRDEYEEFIIRKYGPEVLEDLKIKHRLPRSFRDIDMIATEKSYKDEYQRLITENGL